MTAMHNIDRNKFIAIIQTQLNETKQLISSLKERTKPISPDSAIGRLSRMEAINEKSIHEANLRKAEQRLILLEKVALRVHQEEFGICRGCDSPIPIKRLEIYPESILCIQCLREANDQ
jgi:DnaK suppressor protein